MSTNITSTPKLGSFLYIEDNDLYESEKPYIIGDGEYTPEERSNIKLEEHFNVAINDVRGREDEFTIEQNSFEFVKHKHALPSSSEESLMDYITATSMLLQERFQATRIICYDSLYRQSVYRSKAQQTEYSEPIKVVHIDHTMGGGKNRIKAHLTKVEADQYLSSEYRARIINVWRPCTPVVYDQPLAFCDPRTVDSQDILAIDRVTQTYNSEVAYLKYNEKQTWYYLSLQRSEETAIFLSCDTAPDSESTFCPHASFSDSSSPIFSEPRKSLELRFIVFNRL